MIAPHEDTVVVENILHRRKLWRIDRLVRAWIRCSGYYTGTYTGSCTLDGIILSLVRWWVLPGSGGLAITLDQMPWIMSKIMFTPASTSDSTMYRCSRYYLISGAMDSIRDSSTLDRVPLIVSGQ